MNNRSGFAENLLYFSFVVALVATLGSLFLSEVMKFEPCKLCWFQRIFMYPLTLLLGIAAVRKDYDIPVYVLPLSIIGGSISLYHYLLQKTPFIHETELTCSGGVSCAGDYLDWFGFITIPLLALIAFVLITIMQFLVIRNTRR